MTVKFELTMDMRKAFFDRQAVARAMDRAQRRAMSRSLAFIRRRAKTSLRRRKRVSKPGERPSVHSQNPVVSLKNILFAYDHATKGGIVGPVGLNQRNMTFRGHSPVPAIMEAGGAVNIREQKSIRGNRWFRRDNRRRTKKDVQYRTRRARYKPRPFMGPALQAEIDSGNVMTPWSNVVTG